MRFACAFVSVSLFLAASACQSPGVGTARVSVSKKASVARAVASPAQGGVVTQPGQASPATTATNPVATTLPAASPTLFNPNAGNSPTPYPSGYVTPLPLGSVIEVTPAPTTTPVVTATLVPPAIQDSVVQSSSLLPGIGELTGYIVEPNPAQAGQYRPVTGVTIVVMDKAEATRRARVTNAGNGTFRMPDVALGDYYVRVEKSGYAADTAPSLVRIYPGYTSGYSVFLVVPDPAL